MAKLAGTIRKHSASKVTLPEMLAETLVDEARNDYLWCMNIRNLSRLACLLGLCSLALFAVLWMEAKGKQLQSPLLLATIMLATLGFQTSETYRDRKRKQGRLIAKLQTHSAALGPAIQLMHPEQDPSVRKAAAEVLKVYLPTLRKEDFGAITRHHRGCLCYMVNQVSRDPALALAAIKALRFVGDESVVCAVQYARDYRQSSTELKAEAQACLQEIEKGAVARKHYRTLLRGSGEGDCISDLLLRSSKNHADIEPEQLLRTVNS